MNDDDVDMMDVSNNNSSSSSSSFLDQPPPRIRNKQVIQRVEEFLYALHAERNSSSPSSILKDIAACEYPLVLLTETERTVLAPDMFSRLTDNKPWTTEKLTQSLPQVVHLTEPPEQLKKIGNGVYGNVYLLKDAKTGLFHKDVCFKIQSFETITDLEYLTPFGENTNTPLPPETRRSFVRPGTQPVPNGYFAPPFVLEALALFCMNRQMREFETSQKEPLVNNQAWSSWFPEIYGTFLAKWTYLLKDKQGKLTGGRETRYAAVSAMQFFDGYQTFESYLEHHPIGRRPDERQKHELDLLQLSWDVGKVLDMIENSKLCMHNYDCHQQNVLIHPTTKKLCIIDPGLAGFLLPVEYMCTYAESLDLQRNAQLRCLADGIPITLKTFLYNVDVHPYNSNRFLEAVGKCLEFYHIPFTKMIALINRKLDQEQRREWIYALTPEIMYKPCSLHSLAVIRGEEYTDECGYDDIALLARTIYHDESSASQNSDYQRLFRRRSLFETASKRVGELMVMLRSSSPLPKGYLEARQIQAQLFAYQDLSFEINSPPLLQQADEAFEWLDVCLDRFGIGVVMGFVLRNWGLVVDLWEKEDDESLRRLYGRTIDKLFDDLLFVEFDEALQELRQLMITVNQNTSIQMDPVGRVVLTFGVNLLLRAAHNGRLVTNLSECFDMQQLESISAKLKTQPNNKRNLGNLYERIFQSVKQCFARSNRDSFMYLTEVQNKLNRFVNSAKTYLDICLQQTYQRPALFSNPQQTKQQQLERTKQEFHRRLQAQAQAQQQQQQQQRPLPPRLLPRPSTIPSPPGLQQPLQLQQRRPQPPLPPQPPAPPGQRLKALQFHLPFLSPNTRPPNNNNGGVPPPQVYQALPLQQTVVQPPAAQLQPPIRPAVANQQQGRKRTMQDPYVRVGERRTGV